MSVVRINKNNNYTVMSNYHLREKEMSLKAKGLLSIMLSLPDDWNYTVSGLVSICKENRTAINNTLKELKEFGYLKVTKLLPNKSENRHKIEYIYDVYEQPQGVKKQGTENLYLDNLYLGNRKQLNTNILSTNILSTNNIKKERKGKAETEKNDQENKKDVVTDKSLQNRKHLNTNILNAKGSIAQTTKENQVKRKSFNEIIEEYTDDVELQNALKEHLRVRVANKKGLTNGILEKALKRLSELAHKISEKIAIVNNAIASGNVTFYPLSDKERKMLDKPSYNIEEYENYDIMDYCNMLERHEKREREQASKWRHEFLGEEYDVI